MGEKIVSIIIDVFGNSSASFGKELLVFIISLLPILELRGGLIAASLLGLEPLPSYIIAVIGNLLPIPLILLLINKILELCCSSKNKGIKKIALWLENKAEKNKAKIQKYGFWGLVIFVGIPLPGTGAWTGSLVAAILNINRKKAFLAIVLGVLMASIIMMIISFGLIENIIR